MHVLADTWAHRFFAGTPSLVINNTTQYFFEIMPDGSERKVRFRHSPSAPDDLDEGIYSSSIYQYGENSIMNLGHGRAGHLPDYGFARYKYMPAWAAYDEVIKDNPSDYLHAFAQMIYALKYLRGEVDVFETERYDFEAMEPYRERIESIILRRQADASADWQAFGESLSGQEIEDFDVGKYQPEYMDADEKHKDDTFLGRFILAALAQKSMVTNRIFKSGNLTAGFSVDFRENGLAGIRDFARLVSSMNLTGEEEDDQV